MSFAQFLLYFYVACVFSRVPIAAGLCLYSFIIFLNHSHLILSSTGHGIKIKQWKTKGYSVLKRADVALILIMNVKMPIIVANLRFVIRIIPCLLC